MGCCPMSKAVGDNHNLMDDALPLSGQDYARRQGATDFWRIVAVALQSVADLA